MSPEVRERLRLAGLPRWNGLNEFQLAGASELTVALLSNGFSIRVEGEDVTVEPADQLSERDRRDLAEMKREMIAYRLLVRTRRWHEEQCRPGSYHEASNCAI